MNTNKKPLRRRIESILQQLRTGLHERDEVLALCVLGALAGQNIFLLGPPGTAKSLLARRVSSIFQDARYFECLLHRFSTPEDLFGAISIKALKEDRQHRKTDGYLPSADLAFLDEIWKASPAILNVLLTLLNERLFRNGDALLSAPLKGLVAASNEIPAAGQGLDALFDRFLLRVHVPPLQDMDNFIALLSSPPVPSHASVIDEDLVTVAQWEQWREGIQSVGLSPETLLVIRRIRAELAGRQTDLDIYVSDRRWQRAADLLRAAAFFCDRDTTNLADTLLLRHCLWTRAEHRETVMGIVEQAVREAGLPTERSLAGLDEEKERLEQEIRNELYHTDNVYATMQLGDEECFEVRTHHGPVYIPVAQMKSRDEFHPFDARGNEVEEATCRFDGQGTCRFHRYGRSGYGNVDHFTPKVLFRKGDKRDTVNLRLVKSLADAVVDLRQRLCAEHERLQSRKKRYLDSLATPFVPDQITQVAANGVEQQISGLTLRIKDCDRLHELAK